MDILLFDTIWHLISSIIVFILGLLVVLMVKKSLHISTRSAVFLYVWHSSFCIVYMLYTLSFDGDSIQYYQAGLQGEVHLYFGTWFVRYLVYFLVNYFDLSYLGVFLYFNIIGSLGLLLFYACIKSTTCACSRNIRSFVTFIVLLPSVSFWTSAIGKDSISFFAVTLALWAALDVTKRKKLITIAVLVMLSVRPHMAGIMVAALAISLLFGANKISIIKKTLIACFLFPVVYALVPFAAEYAGVGNISGIEEAKEFVVKRQSYNTAGGGGIDITEMSLPIQLFTYLFRPLPFEAHSVFALLSSLDNLILLLFFIYAVRTVIKKTNITVNYMFLWVYSIASALVLATTTANLGISVRQKWMVMPILIYLLFAGISARQEQKRLRALRYVR